MSSTVFSLPRRLPVPAQPLILGGLGGVVLTILWRLFLGSVLVGAYGAATGPFATPNGELAGLAAASVFAVAIAVPRLCLP
jgi:hypothetical protein